MDPVSAALAAAGLISSFAGRKSAQDTAKQGLAEQQANAAFQRENVGAQNQNITDQQQMFLRALLQTQQTSGDRLKVAGAAKQDQFGNTVAYDPSTGRWITRYTPEQQRLIDQGQARQESTNVRGAQAGEDYNTARSGYLYRQPPSEAESRAEIAKLIEQARGTGDRALAKLVNRDELRQRGNLPVINTGPLAGSTAGQRLAETMLQARTQALAETGQRKQMHAQEYLPAMAQFEKTANTVAPIDPTGQAIIGMGQQGSQDVQSGYADLTKALLSAYGTGSGAQNQAYGGLSSAYGGVNTAAGNVNAATANLTKAQEPEKLGQYAALIKAMQPNAAQIKANAAAKGVEPQISGTTYTADGTPTPATGTPQYNFPPGAFDTPPEYTYNAPTKTSFNDRWAF